MLVREVQSEITLRSDDFPRQHRTPGRDGAHPAASCRFPAASPGPGQQRQVLHVCAQELVAPSGGFTCNGRELQLYPSLKQITETKSRIAAEVPSSSTDDCYIFLYFYIFLESDFISPQLTIMPQSLGHFKPDLLKSQTS